MPDENATNIIQTRLSGNESIQETVLALYLETITSKNLDSISKNTSTLDYVIEHISVGKEIFTKNFLSVINDSIFEYGFTNKADDYLIEQFTRIGPFVRDWLSEIYVENINNEANLIGLLRVISHLPFGIVYPAGVIIATNAISHKSNAVKESGIRAFENWEDKKCLDLLKNTEISDPWLKKYLESVVKSIEEN